MLTRLLTCCAAALLCACGDDARDAVPDAVPEDAAPASEVLAVPDAAPTEARRPAAAVSDALGAFEGGVAGLAMWEHPVMSFASTVLAANGAAGLAVIPVDREVEGRVVEGSFDGPVAVGYAEAASFAAASSGGEVMLFALDGDRATPIGSVTADADALCMIGDTLLVVGMEATGYAIGRDGTAEAVFTQPGGAGALCAATDERFFVAVPDAPLRSFDAGGGAPLVDDDYAGARLDALAAVATPEGAALVTLSGGRFSVDGPGLAPARVDLIRDGAPVTGMTAMTAGSGNYGSIYRDGVVAVVADGELLLLPWAGVARAAGLEGTQTESLRPAEAATPEPEIRIDLPEIETTLSP